MHLRPIAPAIYRWDSTDEVAIGNVSPNEIMAIVGGLIVGFALETGDGVARGQEKLERKALDLVVVNDALEPGAGFETETNHVTILGGDGSRREVPMQDKRGVADAILDAVEPRLARRD